MESEEIKKQGEGSKNRKDLIFSISEYLASRNADLKEKLKMADLTISPHEFIQKTLKSALILSFGLIIVLLLFTKDFILEAISKSNFSGLILVALLILIIPFGAYNYLLMYPTLIKIRRQREIDYEIVFAARHIAIALKSGMPLFDSFAGATRDYGLASREISKIIDKIVLGVPANQAIKEVTMNNPSTYFNRTMIQVANSINSGADIGSSLESILDQISKEQLISLKEYSQRLTPFVMLYMVLGIVVPTLGIVLLTAIISSIVGGKSPINSVSLMGIGVLVALIQILFLGLIESSRPRYLN